MLFTSAFAVPHIVTSIQKSHIRENKIYQGTKKLRELYPGIAQISARDLKLTMIIMFTPLVENRAIGIYVCVYTHTHIHTWRMPTERNYKKL